MRRVAAKPPAAKDVKKLAEHLRQELETLYKVEGFLASITDLNKLLNLIMVSWGLVGRIASFIVGDVQTYVESS